MASGAGVLELGEIEHRLGIADRLAQCIEDPHAPDWMRSRLAEMLRFRTLMIASDFEDADNCDTLRDDPAFKMAMERLPETGAALCFQPTLAGP